MRADAACAQTSTVLPAIATRTFVIANFLLSALVHRGRQNSELSIIDTDEDFYALRQNLRVVSHRADRVPRPRTRTTLGQ